MLIGPDRLEFTALYQPFKKRSYRLTKRPAVSWPAPMLTLPHAEPMCEIALPALLIKLVRLNAIIRKFRHRYDNPNRNTVFWKNPKRICGPGSIVGKRSFGKNRAFSCTSVYLHKHLETDRWITILLSERITRTWDSNWRGYGFSGHTWSMERWSANPHLPRKGKKSTRCRSPGHPASWN